MNTTLRTPLLDDQWLVAVNKEMDAMPDTVADFATPDYVGRMDAEAGMPCDPLNYYIRLGEIELYISGYNEALDTEEYEEDMEDRLYWSRGGW